jgi:predicted nucleic-acid-binding Zn-ribbon protein
MTEESSKVCSKCGSEIVEGRIGVPIEKINTPEINRMTPGFMQQSLPPTIETFTSEPIWEERTGEKKGFIIKRPEIKKMKLIGYRCKKCNYLEFYAKP